MHDRRRSAGAEWEARLVDGVDSLVVRREEEQSKRHERIADRDEAIRQPGTEGDGQTTQGAVAPGLRDVLQEPVLRVVRPVDEPPYDEACAEAGEQEQQRAEPRAGHPEVLEWRREMQARCAAS